MNGYTSLHPRLTVLRRRLPWWLQEKMPTVIWRTRLKPALERNLRGWSHWDVMALGIDHSVLPALGRALQQPEVTVPLTSDHILALKYLGIRREYADTFEAEEAASAVATEALRELANHSEALASTEVLVGPRGSLVHLGKAMSYLGTHVQSHPVSGPYGEEDGFALWRRDLSHHGSSLALLARGDGTPSKTEVEDVREALLWVSVWHSNLWD